MLPTVRLHLTPRDRASRNKRSVDLPIELVTVRLTGRIPRPVAVPVVSAEAAPRVSTRHVLFEDGWTTASVFERTTLKPGFEAEGPAIVAEDGATTVVPPDARFRIGSRGTLEIQVGA